MAQQVEDIIKTDLPCAPVLPLTTLQGDAGHCRWPLQALISPSMTAPDEKQMLAKAETLIEALPYFQRYAGRTFVVKYGGHAMGDPEAARDFAEDIVLLKAVGIDPVVVHGGGPQIGAMLKKLGVETRFVDGLRVTDKATAEVAEMVLSGGINKELVGWIAQAGGRAIGISGKDGGLVTASKVSRTRRDADNQEQIVDLGFVGEPQTVDTTVIDTVCKAGMIPIIAPIAADRDGNTYNINADTMAGSIAAALGAAAGVFIAPKAVRRLIDEHAPVRQIGSGFTFTEGPIWHPTEHYLLFSDMPGDVRRRWDEQSGVQEVMRPSNKGNGMTYDAELNLLVCEHATSSVARFRPDGTREVLATHYEGRELNSPNDICVKSDGSIWFTDPPYGLPNRYDDPRRELDFCGVYRLAPDGKVTLAHRGHAASTFPPAGTIAAHLGS